MLNYKWNKIKTIVFKLILFLGSIVFFSIGAYIMYVNYKITGGLNPDIDSIFKDFALLYTFGNFAFFN
jgi:hypothetical protein